MRYMYIGITIQMYIQHTYIHTYTEAYTHTRTHRHTQTHTRYALTHVTHVDDDGCHYSRTHLSHFTLETYKHSTLETYKHYSTPYAHSGPPVCIFDITNITLHITT